MACTEVPSDTESDVMATYQPMFVTYSTAKTPTKQGRPDNSMRALPKVSLFGTQKDESLIPLLSVLSTVGRGHGNGELMLQALRDMDNVELFLGNHGALWPVDTSSLMPPLFLPLGASAGVERHRSPDGVTYEVDDLDDEEIILA